MDSLVAGGLDVLAHGPRPVLVVADREEDAVPRQQVRARVGVDVREVGHVVAFALEPAQRVVLPAPQEVARAVEPHAVRAHRVRAIERDLARGTAPAVEGVERPAAPVVVRGVGGDARLEEQGGSALVVAHHEHDVGLPPRRARGEPRQVDPARPGSGRVRGRQVVRPAPAALHQPGGRVGRRHRLPDAGTGDGPRHAARARAAVPAHAEDVDPVVRIERADEQVDGSAPLDAGGRRVALDLPRLGRRGDLPVRGAFLLVLQHGRVARERAGARGGEGTAVARGERERRDEAGDESPR